MTATRLIFCIVTAACCLTAVESTADGPPKAGKPAVDPFRGKTPGEVRDDNQLKMQFVWCPPGFFTMENVEVTTDSPVADDKALPNEDADDFVRGVEVPFKGRQVSKVTPVKVFMLKGYWLGKLEVTQSEWRRLMGTVPWKRKEYTQEGVNFPATYVDWDDAMRFCSELTERERAAGRLPASWEYTLPTEAQWERACRARTDTRFSFGNDDSQIGEYAWFAGNTVMFGDAYPREVGRKKPNAFGLHDMHGNVWEWCRDVYVEKLPGGRDPEVTGPGPDRVLRGGGIFREASDCRSSYRNHHAPDWRLYDLGFRVALSPKAAK